MISLGKFVPAELTLPLNLIFASRRSHRVLANYRPTDPREAPNGSIRRTILDQYRELGLSAQPNKGDNGVHASASAFEGLAEKSNWLGQDPKDDSFGRSLLDTGVSEMKLKSWFNDPQIKLTKSIAGSVFDALEDMDVEECLQKLIELSKLN